MKQKKETNKVVGSKTVIPTSMAWPESCEQAKKKNANNKLNMKLTCMST